MPNEANLSPSSQHPFDPNLAAIYKKKLRLLRFLLRKKALGSKHTALKQQLRMRGVKQPPPPQGPKLPLPEIKPIATS